MIPSASLMRFNWRHAQVNKVKSHPGWPRLMAVVASYLPSLAPRQLTNVFWAVSLA
jgi:hypothetical protein